MLQIDFLIKWYSSFITEYKIEQYALQAGDLGFIFVFEALCYEILGLGEMPEFFKAFKGFLKAAHVHFGHGGGLWFIDGKPERRLTTSCVVSVASEAALFRHLKNL